MRRAAIAMAAAMLATPALAGAPYATDDPQPTDPGRLEIYGFVSGTHVPGDTAGEAGLDMSYGLAKDVQVSLTLPLAYDRTSGRTDAAMGVVEAATKLKLLHQSQGGWTPDVSIFPRVFLPTAPARFGSRRVSLLLPAWAEKDFGDWAVFGGGGYLLNPGPENRNVWSQGLAVTRQLGERLNLGAEVVHRGSQTDSGRAFTALDLGLIYRFTPHWSLAGAAGAGVENARTEGRRIFYLALKADY